MANTSLKYDFDAWDKEVQGKEGQGITEPVTGKYDFDSWDQEAIQNQPSEDQGFAGGLISDIGDTGEKIISSILGRSTQPQEIPVKPEVPVSEKPVETKKLQEPLKEDSPFIKVANRLYAGALHAGTSFNKFIGLDVLPFTHNIFIEPGEKQAATLEKYSQSKNKFANMGYDFIESLGSLAVALPADIATGAAAKLAMAGRVLPKVAETLSAMPDFALGMGIRGAVEGAKEGGKEGVLEGVTTGIIRGAEQATWGMLYGKMGEGVSQIPKMAALGAAGSVYEASKEGRTPTGDELLQGTAEGAAYGVLFSILPFLKRTTEVSKEKTALGKLEKALASDDIETVSKGVGEFFDNENVRPELKQAVVETLKTPEERTRSPIEDKEFARMYEQLSLDESPDVAKRDNTAEYIKNRIATGEIKADEAQTIGQHENIAPDVVNQAIIDGTDIQQMLSDADPNELKKFASDNGIDIPEFVTDGRQVAEIVKENYIEGESNISRLAKQIKNLEQTSKISGMEKAAENLKNKKSELTKILPKAKKEAPSDREKRKQMVREKPQGEEPGRAIREPERGGDEVEGGRVLQTSEKIVDDLLKTKSITGDAHRLGKKLFDGEISREDFEAAKSEFEKKKAETEPGTQERFDFDQRGQFFREAEEMLSALKGEEAPPPVIEMAKKFQEPVKPLTKKEKSLQEYKSYIDSLTDEQKTQAKDLIVEEPESPGLQKRKIEKVLAEPLSEVEKPEKATGAPQGEAVGGEKEPWEMTKKEFGDITVSRQNVAVDKEMARGVADATHKERVQQALSEGKPVPKEVLKDYPDLAPAPEKTKVALEGAGETIGKTWESKEGRRKVVGINANGKLEVSTEGSKFPQLLDSSELETTIEFDKKNLEFRKKEDAKLAEEKASSEKIKAEQQDTDGFADQFDEMKKGKIIKILQKQQGISGKFASRKNHIRNLISEGWKLRQVKGERIFESTTGTFLKESDITKTGMDYAEYLSKKSIDKPKPTETIGKAWINNQQKPILSAREITKGKFKGKVEVTLTAGRDADGNAKPGKKVKVDRKAIVEWPEVKDEIRKAISNDYLAEAKSKSDAYKLEQAKSTLEYAKENAEKLQNYFDKHNSGEITLKKITEETGVRRSYRELSIEAREAYGAYVRAIDEYNALKKYQPDKKPSEKLEDFGEKKPQYQIGKVEPISIDIPSLSKEVLSRMNKTLKAKGFDVRGADDIKELMESGRVVNKEGKLWQPDWIDAYNKATLGVESRKKKQAKKAELKNINWQRIRELGKTTNLREAGYIVPDGSLTDLSGKKEGGQPGTRSYDHREAGGTTGMQEIGAYGYIRIDDNSGSIDITKEPTSKQYGVLKELISRNNGMINLDLEDGLGELNSSGDYYNKPDRLFSQFYDEGTKPSRIINDIKRFFSGQEPIPMRTSRYQIGKSIPIIGSETLISILRKVPPLKGADIGLSNDNSVWVRNKSGKGFNVKSVRQIDPDKIAIQIGHGRMLDTGEFIKGKYQDGTIELHRDLADQWTATHEALHAMKDMGMITRLDESILANHVKGLQKKGKWDSQERKPGSEEDWVAYAVEYMRDRSIKGPVRKVLQKIADAVDMFVNIFHRTARGVLREIETGKAFQRMKSKALSEGMPLFQIGKAETKPRPERPKKTRERIKEVTETGFIKRMRDEARNAVALFAPTTISKEAELGATIRRTHLGKATFQRNAFVESSRKFSAMFDWLKPDKQMEVTMAAEENKFTPKYLKSLGFNDKEANLVVQYGDMRKDLMNNTWKQLNDRGLLNAYIEDYVSHMYKDPEKASKVLTDIVQRRPLAGKKYYLKQRTIDLYRDAIDMGLEPKYTNLVDIDTAYMSQALKLVSIHDTITELKDMDRWKFVKLGKKAPDGFMKIKDPIANVYFRSEKGMVHAGHYYAPNDIARLLNNEASPGLYGKSAVYDLARETNALWNMANLSLSAFHGTFTHLTWAANNLGLGLSKLLRGQMYGSFKHFMRSVPGLNIPAFAKDIKTGIYYRDLALHPEKAKTPAQKMAVQALSWANADPKLDRFYASSFAENFKRAVKQKQIGKATVKLPFAMLEKTASPIMKHLVPDIKYSAFIDLFKDEVARKKPTSELEYRKIAVEAYDMIEDRFGQMSYDNLMWNRTFKDSLMIAIRAVGWNFGDIREVAGATHNVTKIVKDTLMTGKLPKNKAISNRVFFVLGVPLTIAMYGAVYSYLKGIKPSSLFDYVAPRTGNQNSDGSPERIMFASYLKDWIAAYKEGPFQMAKNKASPLVNSLAELMSNKDYWGKEIYSTDEGYQSFAKDMAEYAAEKWIPFSFQNLAKMHQRGASVLESVQPLMGIIPAPKYMTNTPAQAYIYETFKKTRGISPKEMEKGSDWRRKLITDYKKTGRFNQADIREGISKGYITKQGIRNLKRNIKYPSNIRMFKYLHPELQARALEKSNEKEFLTYYKYASKRARYIYRMRTLRKYAE